MPVEKIIYKDRPVPVQMSPERVVVKEIPYEVEVIKEVPVPVERVVYKVGLCLRWTRLALDREGGSEREREEQ